MDRKKVFKLQGIISLIAALIILVGTLFIPTINITVNDYSGLKNDGTFLATINKVVSLAKQKGKFDVDMNKYVETATDGYENRHERTEKEIIEETQEILENAKIDENIDDALKMRLLYYSIISAQEEDEKVSLDWAYRDGLKERLQKNGSSLAEYQNGLYDNIRTSSAALFELLDNVEAEYDEDTDGVSYSFAFPSVFQIITNLSKINALVELKEQETAIINKKTDIENTKHEIERLQYEKNYKILRTEDYFEEKQIKQEYDKKIESANDAVALLEKEIKDIENSINASADKYINSLNDVSFSVFRYLCEYKAADIPDRAFSSHDRNTYESAVDGHSYSARYYAPYYRNSLPEANGAKDYDKGADITAKTKYELYLGSSDNYYGAAVYPVILITYFPIVVEAACVLILLLCTFDFFRKEKKEKDRYLYGKRINADKEKKIYGQNVYSYGICAFTVSFAIFMTLFVCPLLCCLDGRTKTTLSLFGIIIVMLSAMVLIVNCVGGRIRKIEGESKRAFNIVQIGSLIQAILCVVATIVLVKGVAECFNSHYGIFSLYQKLGRNPHNWTVIIFACLIPAITLSIMILFSSVRLTGGLYREFTPSINKPEEQAHKAFNYKFYCIVPIIILLGILFIVLVPISVITGKVITAILLFLFILATQITQKVLLKKSTPSLLNKDMRTLVCTAYFVQEEQQVEEKQN